MKNASVLTLLGLTLLLPASSFAQTSRVPVDNVGKRHPNLAEAQRLCTEAYQKLVASQKANEYDEGGHAQKAKELLDAANREIRQAATVDNKRTH